MSINKKRRSTGRVTLADVAQLAGVAATSQILRRQVDTVPPSDPVGVAADSEDRPDPTRTTALPPLPERTPSR